MPVQEVNKRDYSEKFPFVDKMSARARRIFDQHAARSKHPAKKVFIEKGSKVAGVCLVEAGALRVFNARSTGKETTLYTVTAGQSCLLAINCVFSDMAYPAWVRVGPADTQIISIPAAAYRELYQIDDAVRDFTFEVLSRRVFDLMTRLEEASLFDLDRRLASFLVRAADQNGFVKTTHQDIAAHLGSAREVVSRILLSFRREALVETARGSIRIRSMKRLAEYGEDEKGSTL